MPTQSAAGSTSRKEKTETKLDRELRDIAGADEHERDHRAERSDDSADDLFNLAHTD